MRIPFTKMQALGNDFVLLEERDLVKPLSSQDIRFLADRRLGVGCDQVILMRKADAADAEIRFYNADGSEALACGNGTRCAALYLGHEAGQIQTPSGLSPFWREGDEIKITLKNPLVEDAVSLPSSLQGYPVDVGNHHMVVFVEALNRGLLEELGEALQSGGGVNVEMACVSAPSRVEVDVWERGVGLTPACGSGACAVAVVALNKGFVEPGPVTVHMDGGKLEVEWAQDKPLFLKGPAHICFKGTIDLP